MTPEKKEVLKTPPKIIKYNDNKEDINKEDIDIPELKLEIIKKCNLKKNKLINNTPEIKKTKSYII